MVSFVPPQGRQPQAASWLSLSAQQQRYEELKETGKKVLLSSGLLTEVRGEQMVQPVRRCSCWHPRHQLVQGHGGSACEDKSILK